MIKNFDEVSKTIIEAVGGKDNVVKLTHCATRLRFNIKDRSIVEVDKIEKIEEVAGTQWFGDQFQIIIGNNVDDVYESVQKVGNFTHEEKIGIQSDKPIAQDRFSWKNIGSAILSYTGPTMTRVIPLLVAVSMIKTIGSILGPDILNVIPANSEIHIIVDFIYSAFFYFLPVYLGYAAASTLKINPLYGLYLGSLIIVPGFISLVEVQETISVFGIPAPVGNYSNSFLPVMLGVIIMFYVLKFSRRIIPNSLATIFVPTITILIMTPVMFVICAPLGSYLGDVIGSFFIMLSQSNIVFSIIGAVVLSAFFPFMVLSGMHGALVTFALTSFFANNVESFLFPIMLAYNFAVFGVALGVSLKLKKPENKSLSFSYFLTGVLGSISEPALYGVVLKYKSAMKALIISCAVAGLFVGIFQPQYYVMSAATIFTFWVPWPLGGTMNLILGIILMLGSITAGTIFAFAGTYKED